MTDKDNANLFELAKKRFLSGLESFEKEDYKEAEKYFRESLKTIPNRLSTLINLGATLLKLKKFGEAYETIQLTVKLNPHSAEAQLNLGNYYNEQKEWEKAVMVYDKAISINPDYADAYFNRGDALKELKQLHAAVASYDKAIGINPGFAEAHFNKGCALLLGGNFLDGWVLYEWRWKTKNTALKSRNFPRPLWLGAQSLKEKTILLHNEQGLGDAIQFVRYAKLVKDLGARVLLEIPKSLIPLLEQIECVDELGEIGNPRTDFDYHCPLISLPLAFKTQLNTIPFQQAYLHGNSNKIAEWQARLGKKTKLRVGLAWSGNVMHENDHNRSLTLDTLLPYLSNDFDYVCLQNELREIDKDALHNSPIRFFGHLLGDFADTAALCELVDVCISVDTSVAHLAGALGMRTWVLLPYLPDWRWLLDRNDSPWYESMRLYRQDADRDWAKVLTRVTTDLHKLTFEDE